MAGFVVQAYAKINLTLDVLGKRPDGYHELRMVMQTVSLSDRITLTQGGAGLRVITDLSYLPSDDRNLAAIAARRFWAAAGMNEQGLAIAVEKHIPVCAGMAGGSSDGAAVLRAMNQMYSTGFSAKRLAEIGAGVGSDVPYCVTGGTALAEGRGEQLRSLPSLPFCWVVLCKPRFPVSTPELFARVDGIKLKNHPDTKGMMAALEEESLQGVAHRMFNVFEDVLPDQKYRTVKEIKATLLECGALGASMSGTGPTVFGLFDDKGKADLARNTLRESYRDTFLAETV